MQRGLDHAGNVGGGLHWPWHCRRGFHDDGNGDDGDDDDDDGGDDVGGDDIGGDGEKSFDNFVNQGPEMLNSLGFTSPPKMAKKEGSEDAIGASSSSSSSSSGFISCSFLP